MRKKRLLKEKKAILIISILALIAMVFLADQLDPTVSFPDAGLEQAVRNKLRKPLNQTNLLSVTELDASGLGIENLAGIENLRKLVSLNLDNNNVKDLSPLAELNLLTELSLSNNEIIELSAVNIESIYSLPIRELNLNRNVKILACGQEKSLSDIVVLSNFMQLEKLELRGNNIEDVSPLSNLGFLYELDLRGNNISNLYSLSNLVALEKLNLRENTIKNLSALESLTELRYLNLHSNHEISSIEPLSELTNLETLILRNVPIGDQITYLRNLSNLHYLNVRGCGIKNLEVIGDLMATGALQDDPDERLEATVDLRDNILFITDSDPYDPVKPLWGNITYRFPQILESYLEPPEFSQQGGLYNEKFIIELSTNVPGATIYYTLDGSTPSPNNTEGVTYTYKNQYPFEPGDPFGDLLNRDYRTFTYNQPILLDSNIDNAAITEINTTNVAEGLRPQGEVFTGTVIRAVTYKDGFPVSPVVTNSYFIDDTATERYHLPVISIVTSEPNLFDYHSGIYVAGKKFDDWRLSNPLDVRSYYDTPANYHQRGIEWEKEANIEIFKPGAGQVIQQLAGIRVHGGTSRARPNKSLRLYARSDYGDNIFYQKLFDELETNQFKRFILRNSGDDLRSTMFRDALMQNLVKDLGLDQQAYQSSVLFVNGVFWGIINIRERIDRFYLNYRHGVDLDTIDLLEGNAIAKEGTNEHYLGMLDYITANDPSDDSVYAHIQTLMDVDNYINYTTSQIYFNNTDWPGSNLTYWRLRTEQFAPYAPYGHDGRWRWILYDTDFGFGWWGGDQAYLHDTLSFATEEGGQTWPNPDWSTFLLRTLLENEKFKNDFINRFADHLNTIFKPETVIEQINEMQNNIAPLMPEHISRWGEPSSMDRWDNNVEVMRDFAYKRPDALRAHIDNYFGLGGTVELHLTTDVTKGTIVINTVDTRKYLSDRGGLQDWKGIYFKGIPVKITAVANEGYSFSGWLETEEYGDTINILSSEDIYLTAIFDK